MGQLPEYAVSIFAAFIIIVTALSGKSASLALKMQIPIMIAVAQFVTILFLTLYVIINFSAAIEKLVRDPSYRPIINIPWYISILGSLGAILPVFKIKLKKFSVNYLLS